MPQGLTDKEMRALRILANSPRPVPAKDLATMVEVSERSARSYVKAINCAAGYELIVGSRSGYTGDKSRMQALLQQNAKSTTSKSIHKQEQNAAPGSSTDCYAATNSSTYSICAKKSLYRSRL